MSRKDNYFEHDADVGIIGYGTSMEACFADAAKAMFALMADLSAVHPSHEINVEFTEEDIELAFVTWLNLLIGQAQANNLILAEFELKKTGFFWQGKARGESWHAGIERGIEVKGATLTLLSVKQKGDLWQAKCVVDV
ncbi:archease [Legionella feeleii]|uniref:Archease n=1 Tax=Legionella feeleii TaxID=453 RepID=A0A378IP72_9GAMM|nr:archease [Legionella feeleii]STX36939.1 Archease [Legionella feeleii]